MSEGEGYRWNRVRQDICPEWLQLLGLECALSSSPTARNVR